MRTDPEVLARQWDWPAARERCLREARRFSRTTDPEDVVQEALLRAWKTRTSLRETGRPMPWLLQITRNEALRAHGRASADGERMVLVAEPEGDPGPDDWTDAIGLRALVETALRHLHEDERTMVSLRYASELTHHEIADVMGIPVGTCKVRLHRLRKRLAAILKEDHIL